MSIEDLLAHPLLWRGNGSLAGTAAVATGFAALDHYLPGGGWPLTGITEIGIERYGLGELSILMPALATLSRRAARRWIVWVAPPFVPYAPALAQHGIDLDRILLVHPSKKRGAGAEADRPEVDGDSLWAVEQAIRSQSSVAVLAWVREADVPALRRLQLGAEASRCWTVLFRPAAALRESSPAVLRFSLAAAASAMRVAPPVAGLAGIEVEIHKCRGRRPRSFLLEPP
jgi:cell division inhibitor SulA/protein ImuA